MTYDRPQKKVVLCPSPNGIYIPVSEGVKNNKGKFLSESDTKDAFGSSQLGGVAPYSSYLINKKLKLKNHWAVADYL